MTLNTPITIAGFTVTTLTPRYLDDPTARLCSMSSPGMVRALVLWQGDAYTAAGQWTDAQALARIQALADSGALAACFTP